MSMNSALMQETDDVALNFGEEEGFDKSSKLKHPMAVFFHLVFRSAALLAYLVCGIFSSSFITNFVVIILLLCMDFWTVKNISGRLLVGLRWWNYVDENGQNHWIYESRKGTGTVKMSVMESRIFWLSLVVCQIIWIVFLLAAVFQLSFKWFMVVIVGSVMNGANLYGYIRCKVGAKKKLSSVATSFLSTQLFKSVLSTATKAATSPPEQQKPASSSS